MNSSVPDTIEVDTESLLNWLLAYAMEGNVEWFCDDEVKEKTSYSDLRDPSNVVNVEQTDGQLIVHSRIESSVSEKVSRATRWQPAEYRNHPVDVWVETVVEWPDEPRLDVQESVVVQQDGDPLGPPDPDPHAV